MLAVLTALMWTIASSTGGRRKPNILVVWGDDFGWDNIGACSLGIMSYHTLNIDLEGGCACHRLLRAAEAAPRAGHLLSSASICSARAC
jgi:hypothetical protein